MHTPGVGHVGALPVAGWRHSGRTLRVADGCCVPASGADGIVVGEVGSDRPLCSRGQTGALARRKLESQAHLGAHRPSVAEERDQARCLTRAICEW